MASFATPGPESVVTVKINYDGCTRRAKMVLRDMVPVQLESQVSLPVSFTTDGRLVVISLTFDVTAATDPRRTLGPKLPACSQRPATHHRTLLRLRRILCFARQCKCCSIQATLPRCKGQVQTEAPCHRPQRRRKTHPSSRHRRRRSRHRFVCEHQARKRDNRHCR